MTLGTARTLFFASLVCLVWGCDGQPLNNPHPHGQAKANVYYASFAERPRTFDPARSYAANEYQFIGQILEPPLQYHYLLRPYQLIPNTVTALPKVSYFDNAGNAVTERHPQIAKSEYVLTLKPGIMYQPHPAFAQGSKDFSYHDLDEAYLEQHDIHRLRDFAKTGTRELVADDYINQIKRLAHPDLHSPVLGLMSQRIVGLPKLAKQLRAFRQKHPQAYIDLRKYSLAGVKRLSRYQWQITIKGEYPQFSYWLAMPFFAPVPWEVDHFFSQPGMEERNLTMDWYPVGTGAYMLTENNPNLEMILERNPNFHADHFPAHGMPTDQQQGLLAQAGKKLPFIDKAIFSLEKEAVPRWNKFLQGYYDLSGISSDSFDQAIAVDEQGNAELTPVMKAQGIRLQTSVEPSIFYFGFNMLDPVVGGYSERARKLRHAIAIAMDQEEYISIFLNGRGVIAQSMIPPGIYGYRAGEAGINHAVYEWRNGRAQRKSLQQAQQLLADAGYPNGRDRRTGKPLVINYDAPVGSGPDDKAQLDWMRKQFRKLGVQLHIRATQYNRFQQKMRAGNAQLFVWGWHADYPDPENFLFLLYGPNGKVKHGGENAANYRNPEFDKLFVKMKSLDNGPERQALIDKLVAMFQHDMPWIPRFHPQEFKLLHQWVKPSKPNSLITNSLKYMQIEPEFRARKQKQWNKPIVWPITLFILLIFATGIPVYWRYRRQEHANAKGEKC